MQNPFRVMKYIMMNIFIGHNSKQGGDKGLFDDCQLALKLLKHKWYCLSDNHRVDGASLDHPHAMGTWVFGALFTDWLLQLLL